MDSEYTTPAHDQPHATLARIKAALARLDAERASEQLQPGKKPRPTYTAEPYLSASDLAAWETANKVLLPEAYRLFLLEIGNGGMMPGAYCDFEMWPLDDPKKKKKGYETQPREPFPLSRERFEQQMARLHTEGREALPLFPELNEYRNGAMPGCLALGRYPSYDPLYLVVNGDLRGTVWCIVGDWVVEISRQDSKPFDFLGWFEDALVELSTW